MIMISNGYETIAQPGIDIRRLLGGKSSIRTGRMNMKLPFQLNPSPHGV